MTACGRGFRFDASNGVAAGIRVPLIIPGHGITQPGTADNTPAISQQFPSSRFDAAVASADSSSLLSAFFLERISLTRCDVVRSRYVVLSMPNAISKLPFRLAGDLTSAR